MLLSSKSYMGSSIKGESCLLHIFRLSPKQNGSFPLFTHPLVLLLIFSIPLYVSLHISFIVLPVLYQSPLLETSTMMTAMVFQHCMARLLQLSETSVSITIFLLTLWQSKHYEKLLNYM